jgi:hypothetical protein
MTLRVPMAIASVRWSQNTRAHCSWSLRCGTDSMERTNTQRLREQCHPLSVCACAAHGSMHACPLVAETASPAYTWARHVPAARANYARFCALRAHVRNAISSMRFVVGAPVAALHRPAAGVGFSLFTSSASLRWLLDGGRLPKAFRRNAAPADSPRAPRRTARSHTAPRRRFGREPVDARAVCACADDHRWGCMPLTASTFPAPFKPRARTLLQYLARRRYTSFRGHNAQRGDPSHVAT